MKVVIAAGGTAGHINPALAIAGEIKKREPNSEIVFVGRADGMEKQLVEKAGYKLFPIEMHGFMRKLTLENIIFNLNSIKCVFSAEKRIGKFFKEFKPDIVIGCGGYVSGPVLRKAANLHIPTAIQEQNAIPGITTKLLANKVDIIFAASQEGSDALGHKQKTIVTGNPIRLEFFKANREILRKQWDVKNRVCIVSFGGSLGAKTINKLSACLMAKHQNSGEIFHIHGAGGYDKTSFEQYKKQYGVDPQSKNIMIVEYIDNMPECLAAADLVICRAGALTISELEASGRASVLIPSPNVAENHQYYNALALANEQAAILFEEKEIDYEKVSNEILALASDKQKLSNMGINARNRAKPDTATKIYNEIVKLIEKNKQKG